MSTSTKLRAGDRVKCVEHDAPKYGSVGTVVRVFAYGATVKFDYEGDSIRAMQKDWLRKVAKGGSWRSSDA